MGRCRNSDGLGQTGDQSSLAKALAPEEIRSGDFVAALYVISEWPSWFWDDNALSHPRDELVRICAMPTTEPLPWEVRGVCLPFVLVRAPDGIDSTLDVRKCRLARLDAKFGRRAWRALRASRRKRDSEGQAVESAKKRAR
jgi:hypothetical protein